MLLISVDIETSCNVKACPGGCTHALDPYRNKIDLVGVAWEGGSRVFTDLTLFSKWLNSQRIHQLVGHNFKFDRHNLIVHGVPAPLLPWAHDTQLLSVAIQDKIPESWLIAYNQKRTELNKALPKGKGHRNASPHSLKTLCPYFLNVAPFWEDPTNHNDVGYVLKDAEYTLRLFKFFKEKYEGTPAWKFYEEKLLPWTRDVLHPAEMRGVALDMEALEKAEKTSKARLVELESELKRVWKDAFEAYRDKQIKELNKKYDDMKQLAVSKAKDSSKILAIQDRYNKLFLKALERGIEPLNLASPTQLSWLLKDHLGLDITQIDNDEEESTGKAVLERLAAQGREDIKLFLEYRKESKLCTAFYPSYREMQEEGVIRTSFNPSGTRTGRLSSSGPNCLSLDTEVLTSSGYKFYNNITTEDLVACWNLDGTITFERPTGFYISDNKKKSLIKIKNQHIDWLLTANHRCLIEKKHNNSKHVYLADSLPKHEKILHGGYFHSKKDTLPKYVIQLIAAIQADAELTNRGTKVRLEFRRQRKIIRLREILTAANIQHTETKTNKDTTRFIFDRPSYITEYLSTDKKFTWSLLNLSDKNRAEFLEELRYWDGLSTRSPLMYTSKYKINCDIVQALLSISSKRGHLSVSRIRGKDYYRVYGTNKSYSYLSNCEIKEIESKERVWCLKVNSSFFIARRGSNTFVTGNCQQVPSNLHALFRARDGHKLICRDASGIEARLIALYTNEPTLYDIVANGGDIHGNNARIFFGLECDMREVKEKFPAERKLAKTVGFALFYGAGYRRIKFTALAQGITWSDAECKEKLYRFKNDYEASFAFKNEVLDPILMNGEEVTNLLGRPMRITAKDDVYMKGFNRLIQSSASDLILNSAWKAQMEYNKLGLGAHVVLLVHDEIVVEAPNEHVKQCEDILVRAMVDYPLTNQLGPVPLAVEGSTSNVWSK